MTQVLLRSNDDVRNQRRLWFKSWKALLPRNPLLGERTRPFCPPITSLDSNHVDDVMAPLTCSFCRRGACSGEGIEGSLSRLYTSARTAVQGVLVALLPSSWSLSQKQTSSSHIGVGGAFILPVAQEVEAAGPQGRAFWRWIWGGFWLRFAFTAMQVSALADFLCFRTVLDLILSRLQGQVGAFRRCIFGLFLITPKQHGPKWSHIAFNTAPKSPKLAPRWHQREIAVLDPHMEPTNLGPAGGTKFSRCKTDNMAEQNLTCSFNMS